MKTINANIITGFLGAGKTTAIIELFKQKPKQVNWVVVINEFGKVAIDSMIVKDNVDDSSGVREIIGGCICCSSRDYFREHIQEIVDRQNPDRIIIEPTGLGGIQEVKDILANFPAIQIAPVICLVDVNSHSNPRFQMNPIYLKQISDCDGIVISKCDSVENDQQPEALINWIKGKYAEKLFYRKIAKGKLDIDLFKQNITKKELSNQSAGLSILGIADKNKEYAQRSYSYPAEAQFDIKAVKQVFAERDAVIRAKGYLNTTNGWVLFQSVMGQFTVEPAEAKACNEIVTIWKDISSVQDLDSLLING